MGGKKSKPSLPHEVSYQFTTASNLAHFETKSLWGISRINNKGEILFDLDYDVFSVKTFHLQLIS
jgi:hypothetical protein